MPVAVKDSSEKVGGGFKLMTGATTASVVAIHPTVQEMKEVLGFDEPRTPSDPVGKDNNGNTSVRIDFWLQPTGSDNYQKMSLFLSKAYSITKNGDKQWYTNSHGQFGCFPIPAEGTEVVIPEKQAKFFNPEGLRPAYQGEERLVNFIQMWANLEVGKKGDDVTLDFDALFNGDFTELRQIMTACNEGEPNIAGVMFGVRTVEQEDGSTKNYQDVYTKAFFRPSDNLNQKFTEQLNDPYGAWDREYQDSTVWKEYDPTSVNAEGGATEAGEDTTEEESAWV